MSENKQALVLNSNNISDIFYSSDLKIFHKLAHILKVNAQKLMESMEENLSQKIEQYGKLFTQSLECLLNLVYVPLSGKDSEKKEERLLMAVT